MIKCTWCLEYREEGVMKSHPPTCKFCEDRISTCVLRKQSWPMTIGCFATTQKRLENQCYVGGVSQTCPSCQGKGWVNPI